MDLTSAQDPAALMAAGQIVMGEEEEEEEEDGPFPPFWVNSGGRTAATGVLGERGDGRGKSHSELWLSGTDSGTESAAPPLSGTESAAAPLSGTESAVAPLSAQTEGLGDHASGQAADEISDVEVNSTHTEGIYSGAGAAELAVGEIVLGEEIEDEEPVALVPPLESAAADFPDVALRKKRRKRIAPFVKVEDVQSSRSTGKNRPAAVDSDDRSPGSSPLVRGPLLVVDLTGGGGRKDQPVSSIARRRRERNESLRKCVGASMTQTVQVARSCIANSTRDMGKARSAAQDSVSSLKTLNAELRILTSRLHGASTHFLRESQGEQDAMPAPG